MPYSDVRKERCEWCRKGSEPYTVGGLSARELFHGLHFGRFAQNYRCTAPTKNDYIVELEAEKAARLVQLETQLRINSAAIREWRDANESLKAENTRLREQHETHLRHVGRWLAEMHAIMIDPVEDFDGKIEELCAALKLRAAQDREQIFSVQSALDEAQGAIETLLKSARPNHVEHPTMSAAWVVGHECLSRIAALKEPK